ncbi:MAG: hypothetical protein ACI97A_001037 [Planctomycetota bacterium]|jgi:hypothetical protein
MFQNSAGKHGAIRSIRGAGVFDFDAKIGRIPARLTTRNIQVRRTTTSDPSIGRHRPGHEHGLNRFGRHGLTRTELLRKHVVDS